MLILHFDTVSSTNTIASLLKDYSERVIITANYQTLGYGRNGKSWLGNHSENIYISYALTGSSLSQYHTPLYFQACSVLSVQAFLLDYLESRSIAIKYPNDIYVNDGNFWKKISGILIQSEYSGSHLETVIIGIGVNIMQTIFGPDLQQSATSLVVQYPDIRSIPITTLSIAIVQKLHYYFTLSPLAVINQWHTALNIIGKQIYSTNQHIYTTVNSISDDGTLITYSGSDKICINNGDSILYDLHS